MKRRGAWGEAAQAARGSPGEPGAAADLRTMHHQLRRCSAPPDAAALQSAAAARREAPTRAERALEAILNGLGGGALEGRFRREWVCGGRWIVDFYFPEVRLGIEVDGGYHRSRPRRSRDLLKESDLAAAGVTLLRVTNEEVFGDRGRLLAKLREAWRNAARSMRPPAGRAGS